jgi:hypothetical protein
VRQKNLCFAVCALAEKSPSTRYHRRILPKRARSRKKVPVGTAGAARVEIGFICGCLLLHVQLNMIAPVGINSIFIAHG